MAMLLRKGHQVAIKGGIPKDGRFNFHFFMSPLPMYPGVIALDDNARSLEDRKHAQTEPHQHSACHCDRTRHTQRKRLLNVVAAVISLIAIGSLLFFACSSNASGLSFIRDGGLSNLISRDTTGNTSGDFVHRKFYLIVAIVGLFIVLILGIMLSAWCCRGSFENPLCCPCYLCACCGGLACLECIGCGLCAEGLGQV